MINVLICDDDERFLAVLKNSVSDILRSMGIPAAVYAYSRAEDITEANYQDCDIVFLDIDFRGETYSGILCLLYSLALELALLYLLLPELNTFWAFALNAICIACVFLLAPVNDRSIHLNAAELKACKRSGRARMLLLDALLIAAYLLSADSVVNGLTLGNTMTALLLVIAKIKKENKDNEENDRVPQESR